ncbi:hypothetical protein ABC345_02795 [Shouchella sp. 1P09AA]|uniref:hypothetical protein n=2 Tax=unclassified Shouchella TaxID=2893065 RepID=UPI0039A11DE4
MMADVALLFSMLVALACFGAPIVKTWKYLVRQMIIGSFVLIALFSFLFLYDLVEGTHLTLHALFTWN